MAVNPVNAALGEMGGALAERCLAGVRGGRRFSDEMLSRGGRRVVETELFLHDGVPRSLSEE